MLGYVDMRVPESKLSVVALGAVKIRNWEIEFDCQLATLGRNLARYIHVRTIRTINPCDLSSSAI